VGAGGWGQGLWEGGWRLGSGAGGRWLEAGVRELGDGDPVLGMGAGISAICSGSWYELDTHSLK